MPAVGIGAFGLAAVGTAIGVAARPGPPDSGRAEARPTVHTFEIQGDVAGLVPNVESNLDLTIENTTKADISVTGLDVDVGDPVGDCSADDLVVGEIQVPISVPKAGEVEITVRVRLADDVDETCQGVRWPLVYTATARRQ